MKKSTMIFALIVVVVVIVGIAFGVRNSNSNNNNTANVEQTTVDTNESTKSVVPVPADASKFFEDYINLQNEVSKKVQTGDYAESDYMDFLQKGVEITQLKEQYEKDGNSEELSKGISEIKPYLFTVAKDINSELADNFKAE